MANGPDMLIEIAQVMYKYILLASLAKADTAAVAKADTAAVAIVVVVVVVVVAVVAEVLIEVVVVAAEFQR